MRCVKMSLFSCPLFPSLPFLSDSNPQPSSFIFVSALNEFQQRNTLEHLSVPFVPAKCNTDYYYRKTHRYSICAMCSVGFVNLFGTCLWVLRSKIGFSFGSLCSRRQRLVRNEHLIAINTWNFSQNVKLMVSFVGHVVFIASTATRWNCLRAMVRCGERTWFMVFR